MTPVLDTRSRRLGGPQCATRSRLLDEPLAATGAAGSRWLLVELAGAWGWSAFTESPALDPDVGRMIVQRAERAGLRIAAIRRPGRARGAARWRWATVDSTPGAEHVRWGEVPRAEALLELPLDGSAGTASTEPVFVVCTHGRHDECCAVRGRSVAVALADAYPEATWECSHIGGDRFAATMILFPHGLTYGRVDELDPAAIARRYLDEGAIEPDGFRGRTSVPRIVQAAQAAVRERFGDLRVDAYPAVSSVEDDDGWTVVLGADAPVEVRLEATPGVPTFTTCRAHVAVAVPGFRVVGMRAAGGHSVDA